MREKFEFLNLRVRPRQKFQGNPGHYLERGLFGFRPSGFERLRKTRFLHFLNFFPNPVNFSEGFLKRLALLPIPGAIFFILHNECNKKLHFYI